MAIVYRGPEEEFVDWIYYLCILVKVGLQESPVLYAIVRQLYIRESGFTPLRHPDLMHSNLFQGPARGFDRKSRPPLERALRLIGQIKDFFERTLGREPEDQASGPTNASTFQRLRL
ncbi:hypothetical protein [Rhodobacter maris]|uniref:hypothetical protein n=1 Tax=Rhodobacter maris TaxID=446682 RepID=UPI001143794E|nr:hypothetical protein [Rhodobacter maris]